MISVQSDTSDANSKSFVFLHDGKTSQGMAMMGGRQCGLMVKEILSLTHRLRNPYAYLTHLDRHTLEF